ncbi:unnamed protein product [Camellia sinensis]
MHVFICNCLGLCRRSRAPSCQSDNGRGGRSRTTSATMEGLQPSAATESTKRVSFLRLERWAIRRSKVESRLAVRSNSVRLGGSSTESRSCSWKFVRSRTIADDDSLSSSTDVAKVSSKAFQP